MPASSSEKNMSISETEPRLEQPHPCPWTVWSEASTGSKPIWLRRLLMIASVALAAAAVGLLERTVVLEVTEVDDFSSSWPTALLVEKEDEPATPRAPCCGATTLLAVDWNLRKKGWARE